MRGWHRHSREHALAARGISSRDHGGCRVRTTDATEQGWLYHWLPYENLVEMGKEGFLASDTNFGVTFTKIEK